MIAAIIFLVLVAAGTVWFLNTKVGKRLKLRASGTANEMLNQDASTPEGAKAYYNAAIEKKEEEYQKANTVYSQMLGKISSFEQNLRAMQKEDMQLTLDINSCIDQGNDEGAKVYLERQQENKDKIEVLKNSLKEIKENSVLQKETVDKLYDDLKALKSEKDKAIFTLETVEATKALKPDTGVGSNEQEKMLQKVREGVQKAKEESDGNRIAYESSAEVQKKRLDKQMKNNAIDQKLAELKAKKGKM